MSNRRNRRGSGSVPAAASELEERAQRLRAQAASRHHNKLSQPQNRWQRAVRYNWDKNRGRG